MTSKWKDLLLGVAAGALVASPLLGVTPVWAEPVKIGASLPMTGGLAINGQKHKAGYELCIDLINQAGGLLGEPVEIVISDNQSSNETAQAQFERLINEDDVDVLFGTFSSRLTFPTTSIAEQNKMVYPEFHLGSPCRSTSGATDTFLTSSPMPPSMSARAISA